MTSLPRFPFLAAGVFGFTGVLLGAVGAHGLAAILAKQGMTHVWETAARYQLFHAVALLAVGVWQGTAGVARRRIGGATYCWTAGILLFSGSLYGLALGGPRVLGSLTPYGGIALMAGWVLVVSAALARDK